MFFSFSNKRTDQKELECILEKQFHTSFTRQKTIRIDPSKTPKPPRFSQEAGQESEGASYYAYQNQKEL